MTTKRGALWNWTYAQGRWWYWEDGTWYDTGDTNPMHPNTRREETEMAEEWQAEYTYPYLENQDKTAWSQIRPSRQEAIAVARDEAAGYVGPEEVRGLNEGWSDALDTVTATFKKQVAALEAVIAEVRTNVHDMLADAGDEHEDMSVSAVWLRDLLATAPSSVLAKRDAELIEKVTDNFLENMISITTMFDTEGAVYRWPTIVRIADWNAEKMTKELKNAE